METISGRRWKPERGSGKSGAQTCREKTRQEKSPSPWLRTEKVKGSFEKRIALWGRGEVSTRKYRDSSQGRGTAVPLEGTMYVLILRASQLTGHFLRGTFPDHLTQNLSFCYFLPLSLVFYSFMIIWNYMFILCLCVYCPSPLLN